MIKVICEERAFRGWTSWHASMRFFMIYSLQKWREWWRSVRPKKSDDPSGPSGPREIQNPRKSIENSPPISVRLENDQPFVTWFAAWYPSSIAGWWKIPPIIVYWVPTAHWSRSFHLAIWIAKSALWVWVKAIQSLFYHILRGMLCYYGIKKDFNRRVAGFYMTLITHSHFVLMDHQTQQWNMAMAHPPFLIFFDVFPIQMPKFGISEVARFHYRKVNTLLSNYFPIIISFSI